MENEELDRLQAVCDAATDGPWIAAIRKQSSASQFETNASIIGPEYVHADRDKAFCEPDGIFIAEARVAMPALIAEVRRLREQNSRLQYMLDYYGFETTEGPELQRYQPCGCQVCICEDQTQCQGCGAKNCGKHPVGMMPVRRYVDGTEKHFDENGECYAESGPMPARV